MTPFTHRFAFTCSATAHRPSFCLEDIYVVATQWMTSLAMRLCAFLSSGGFDHWRHAMCTHFYRIKNSHFWSNSTFQALNNHVRSDPGFSRPVCSDKANAFEGDPYIRGAIAVLVMACIPLAIFRSVIAIIVNTLQPIAFGARPQVVLEIAESLSARNTNAPSITDLYSSAAVAMELRSRGRVTTPKHVDVEIVKLSVFPGSSHAVYRRFI